MKIPKVVILSLALILFGCKPLCGEKELYKSANPDKKYMATMYTRDCGATTAESTRVAITENQTNVKYDILSTTRYYPENLDISWNEEGNLVIDYHDDPKYLFMYKSNYKDIEIKLLHDGIPFTKQELESLDLVR